MGQEFSLYRLRLHRIVIFIIHVCITKTYWQRPQSMNESTGKPSTWLKYFVLSFWGQEWISRSVSWPNIQHGFVCWSFAVQQVDRCEVQHLSCSPFHDFFFSYGGQRNSEFAYLQTWQIFCPETTAARFTYWSSNSPDNTRKLQDKSSKQKKRGCVQCFDCQGLRQTTFLPDKDARGQNVASRLPLILHCIT